MHAAPTSCSAEGDSARISAAKTTEQTGCSVSETDVTTAGSRGSEIVIRSQPSTCELSASRISHPCADERRRQVEVAHGETDQRASDRRGERRVEQRAGRPDHAAPALPQRRAGNPEYASAVRTRRPRRAAGRGRTRLARARRRSGRRRSSTTGIDDERRRSAAARAGAATPAARRERPAVLPSTVASPAPMCSIELCQKIEVGGEERAGDPGEVVRARGPRPELPPLPPARSPERRQRPDAAVERAGRGRDVRELVQDAGKRDRDGADEDGDRRPAREDGEPHASGSTE